MSNIVIITIILAVVFNYVNGFHDTANSIATSIATKSLKPTTAIIFASVLELLGSLFSTQVAQTVGKGIINTNVLTMQILLAAISAAIIWNLVTWYFAIPSSSSHALIGGLIGAAIFGTLSYDSVLWGSLLAKVILPLFLAPFIGFLVGGLFMIILLWIIKKLKPSFITKLFTKLQIFSAGLVALSHGANDAQKSMGIIALALLLGGATTTFTIPLWVQLVCAISLALGTITGGWKIIKTMGNNICKLKPVDGFAAQTATAAVINSATFLIGAPVSTTHIIASSIMGVGSAKRVSAVRWRVVRDLAYTWLVTIPISALIAGIIYKLLMLL